MVRIVPHPVTIDSRTCSKRSRKRLRICWCRWENSAETSSSSGPTRSSGSAMILAMILAIRSGPPGLKGRRRTRDWSGLRIVAVRLRIAWTLSGVERRLLLSTAIGSLKLVSMFCAKLHLRQRKQEGQGGFRSLVPVDPIYMQPIAAAAGLGRVEFESEIVPADEPVEGALRVFVPPRRPMWRDRLPGRPRRLPAPRWAAGRNSRACRRGDRTRCCQSAGSGPSRTSAIPSASAGPEPPLAAPPVVRSPVRSQSRRARASRCRTTVPLRTIASPACALASKSSMSRQVSVSRVWLTRLSPLNRRRYSWMPIRPNAHARGEVNSVSAGNASAKSCPAIIWKLAKGERPTPMPSAQSALPDSPPIPVRPASAGQNSCGCGSVSSWDRKRDGGMPPRWWPAPARVPGPRPIHRAAPPE